MEIIYENNYIISAKFISNDISLIDIDMDSKYKLRGTPFQVKVWQEIAKIPFGETRTYSDIAMAINHPKAYRAVANACGKNKIAYRIPCHRVVNKSGIGGYAYGIELKKKLLDYEKYNCLNVLI